MTDKIPKGKRAIGEKLKEYRYNPDTRKALLELLISQLSPTEEAIYTAVKEINSPNVPAIARELEINGQPKMRSSDIKRALRSLEAYNLIEISEPKITYMERSL